MVFVTLSIEIKYLIPIVQLYKNIYYKNVVLSWPRKYKFYTKTETIKI